MNHPKIKWNESNYIYNRIKHLEINLTKEVQILYPGNYETVEKN